MRFLLMVLVGLVLGCGDDPVPPADAWADARAELDSRGIEYTSEAFLDSAESGNLAVVKLFVAAGMPVIANDIGWRALLYAAYGGHLAVVQYLVGAGANVMARGDDGRTPRDLAARLGHTAVANYLRSVGG